MVLNVDDNATVELESRLNVAIALTQKQRSTQCFLVASWSGEVCPGTCEAGMPNTSLQGRTCSGPRTDLPGSRCGHCKNFCGNFGSTPVSAINQVGSSRLYAENSPASASQLSRGSEHWLPVQR